VGLTLLLLSSGAGCHQAPREPLATYFNGDFEISLQYPAKWRTERAEQDGVWYRYFLAPSSGPQRTAAVSATLLVGPLAGTVEDYAQSYLAGNVLASEQAEKRPGLSGRSYTFVSSDGQKRFALLLLKEIEPPPGQQVPRVFGLFCQGQAEPFERYHPILEQMAASLGLERVQDYVVHEVPERQLLLRLPKSWRHVRRLTADGTRIDHFTSPPLGVEEGGTTVHASLTVTVGPAPHGLDAYYNEVRRKLGPNFEVVNHAKWKDGYMDLMAVETQMASSRIRRFYRVSGKAGYSLAFEARNDVFYGASPWFDFIAETLRVGPDD
jgi:hypothetical protein